MKKYLVGILLLLWLIFASACDESLPPRIEPANYIQPEWNIDPRADLENGIELHYNKQGVIVPTDLVMNVDLVNTYDEELVAPGYLYFYAKITCKEFPEFKRTFKEIDPTIGEVSIPPVQNAPWNRFRKTIPIDFKGDDGLNLLAGGYLQKNYTLIFEAEMKVWEHQSVIPFPRIEVPVEITNFDEYQ